MKTTERYDLYFDEMRLSKNGYWCKYSDVEQLQARIKELERIKIVNYRNGQHSILDRLFHLTETMNNAEEIKQLISKTLNDIDQLKDEAVIINEIKAKGIEEAIKYIDEHSRVVEDDISYFSLAKYIQKLRNKHD